MDLADSSLIVIAELTNITDIITIDSDYYIYKTKNKKSLNNILLPFLKVWRSTKLNTLNTTYNKAYALHSLAVVRATPNRGEKTAATSHKQSVVWKAAEFLEAEKFF